MNRTTERVPFRFISMPCCGHQLCWVNPRFPMHCPECGKRVYPDVKGCVLLDDKNATLIINVDAGEAVRSVFLHTPKESSQ